MRELDLVPVVAVGGALGAAARFGLDVAVPHADGAWPWSTFAINLLGSFILGLVLVGLVRWADDASRWARWSRPFLVTGVLGGFTTFSAYSLQVLDMAAAGSAVPALIYAVMSVVLAVAAVAAGLAAGARLWGPAPSIDAGDA